MFFLLLALWISGVASLAPPSVSPRRPPARCPVWTVVQRPSEAQTSLVASADYGRRDIGWVDVYLCTTHDPLLHARLHDDDGSPHVFLTNLIVDASVRRCGVATSLLLAAERLALEWGVLQIVVSAKPSHAPSWDLYRKLGYTPVRAALSRRSTSVLLCKELAPP